MTAAPERLTLRQLTVAEFDDLYDFIYTAFHQASGDDRVDEGSVWEPERSIGILDGDRIVGSAGAYTRDMTLPGGPKPVACVTAVSVATEYTRQGLLTRMMRHQLTELHEQGGEPVAALWASESAIYGRFGYGRATRHVRLKVPVREVRLRRPGSRSVRTGPATSKVLRADQMAVYERIRGSIVGHLDRRGNWPQHRFYDPEHDREGRGPLRIAIHDGSTGPDGYVLFNIAPKWNHDGPYCTANIREIRAENPEAEHALWAFLLNLDLVGELAGRALPLDLTLPALIDHPRRVQLSIGDNLWVRIVDVDRALALRTYAAPVDVVFDVTDPFCPWNTGRWRLEGGPDGAVCARTGAPADIALTSTDLGAAYLGATSLVSLAAAGGATELRPGALRRAAIAFSEPGAPFCPEVF